ncbi:MAG TPA: ABC transporter ATP-binding protein [Nitrososphaeraceae archaeon]|nr:ABC transporter ATP-binding protein [Nitrososphaeraceae archaeon]
MKIDDNEILVMIGPTGSGKTTVLNLIAGLLEPDNGSILMDGLDITSLPVEARKIGYTFQNPSLFPHLNVYENIIFGLTKKNRKNDNNDLQITRLLNDLGISHLTSRNIQELSGGEMQKISLARMLVTKPKIMLMDEPLAHLDSPNKRRLRLDLRRVLKRQSISTIYVTHFEDDVYALADSVSILQNGVIEKTGRLESILAANPNPSSFLSNIFSGGNYLEGKVVNSKNGVSTFKVGSHLLETLGDYSVDSKLGILVRPEDIILSKEMVKTSARNVVKAKVTNITKQSNSAVADIHLVVDRFRIRSRITEESRTDLGIKEDDYIFAIFKASSPQVVREEDS